jgi:hypothetical protein
MVSHHMPAAEDLATEPSWQQLSNLLSLRLWLRSRLRLNYQFLTSAARTPRMIDLRVYVCTEIKVRSRLPL